MMNEIHDSLVGSGWVQTDEPGQLDNIDAVLAIPSGGNYSLFRIYELIDGHEHLSRVFMKVAFTTHDILKSSTHPSNRVGNWAGTGVWLSDDITFPESKTIFTGYPSTGTGGAASPTSGITIVAGNSMICSNPDLGFYGFVYDSGSYTYDNTAYGDFSAPFAVFIQRHLSSDGEVLPGFSVWVRNQTSSNGGATNGNGTMTFRMEEHQAQYRFIGPEYVSPRRNDSHARAFCEVQTALPGGVIQVAPVYAMTPAVVQVPTLLTYIHGQISAGTQFEAETTGGNTYNFIATGMSGVYAGADSTFAMLFQ